MNNPNPQPLRGAKTRAREPRTRKSNLRRRLVPIEAGNGFVGAAIKSLTPGVESKYHPVLCVETHAVRCDCDDFYYRHAPHEPSLSTPEHWCKHLKRHIRNLQRRGALPKYLEAEVRACSCCGEFGAQFRRAEPEAKHQFICERCVKAAQTAYHELSIAQAQAQEDADALAVEVYLWQHRQPVVLCLCCDAPESVCECDEWEACARDALFFQANQVARNEQAALWAGFSCAEVYGPGWEQITAYLEIL